MSLQQKCEAAILKVVENAGNFSGRLLRSQESDQNPIQLPCCIAVYIPRQPRTRGSFGQSLGNESGTLVLVARSFANKSDTVTDPAATHAANVDAIRSAVAVTNLQSLLNSAAVQPYYCISVIASAPPAVPPHPNSLQSTIGAWELNHVEVTCS